MTEMAVQASYAQKVRYFERIFFAYEARKSGFVRPKSTVLKMRTNLIFFIEDIGCQLFGMLSAASPQSWLNDDGVPPAPDAGAPATGNLPGIKTTARPSYRLDAASPEAARGRQAGKGGRAQYRTDRAHQPASSSVLSTCCKALEILP
jgi:hypothetical protein